MIDWTFAYFITYYLTWVKCLAPACCLWYDWGCCSVMLNQMTQSHRHTRTHTSHKQGGTYISCCISVTCVCVCFDILTGQNLQFEQHIWHFVLLSVLTIYDTNIYKLALCSLLPLYELMWHTSEYHLSVHTHETVNWSGSVPPSWWCKVSLHLVTCCVGGSFWIRWFQVPPFFLRVCMGKGKGSAPKRRWRDVGVWAGNTQRCGVTFFPLQSVIPSPHHPPTILPATPTQVVEPKFSAHLLPGRDGLSFVM